MIPSVQPNGPGLPRRLTREFPFDFWCGLLVHHWCEMSVLRMKGVIWQRGDDDQTTRGRERDGEVKNGRESPTLSF